jgi:tetratricopeptide (TPR) repeat protein
VADYQLDLAITYNSLGPLLHDLGKSDEALIAVGQALTILRKLIAQIPPAPVYQRALATAHNNLGILLATRGKRNEARGEFKEARHIHEELAGQFPSVPQYGVDLGGSYCTWGMLIRDEGKSAESLEWFAKAIATLVAVREKEPRDVRAKLFLRSSYHNRALALHQLRRHAEAVKDWDKVVELSPKPEQAAFRASRAIARLQAGQAAEAVAEVDELTKGGGWDYTRWYYFGCIYAVASGKMPDKRQEYADRAMELLRKAVQAGFKDGAHMAKDSDLAPLRDREDFKKLLAELQGGKGKE